MSKWLQRTSNVLCFFVADNSAIGNEVLAEFLEPYQNMLFQNVSCRFGLSNVYGVSPYFRWTVSQTALNYTYWSPDVDFRNSTGVLTDQGWRLLNDSFQCSIYHLTDLPIIEDVSLNFDIYDDSWFTLEVVQYSQLLYNNGRPLIFCFTDSDATSVLYRLSDFSQLITTNTSYKISFSVINSDESGPGHYWCEAFSYPNFTVVRTVSQLTNYSGEYVVLFTLPRYNEKLGDYPLTSENLETLQNLLKNELPPDCTFYPRVFKINAIDEQSKTMNITFHLTSGEADDTDQEFDRLKNISQSQSVFDFVDFRSVHHCPSSTTLHSGVTVVWGRSNLGETHHPLNGYCVTPAGDLVQRSCDGNFIDGAYWSVVDCPFYPNSSLTNTLVNLMVEGGLSQLKVISQSYQQFNTLDFVLTVKLINQLTDVGDIAEIVSNLARIPPNTLWSAQLNFRSTDLLLKSVELILDQATFGEWNQPNFAVKIVDLTQGIVGFNLDQYNITPVSNATAFLNHTEDLRAAVRLSPILYQQIMVYTTKNTTYTPKMVLTVYYGSQLFVEMDGSHKSADLVIGVSLPDFHQTFQGPVTIYYFPPINQYRNCSFWEFEDGTWIMNGTEPYQNAVACQYYHLTNFALTNIEPDQLDCSSSSYDSTELLTLNSTVDMETKFAGKWFFH